VLDSPNTAGLRRAIVTFIRAIGAAILTAEGTDSQKII
jgi:hypothetical protein